jgi:hypothetical protein
MPLDEYTAKTMAGLVRGDEQIMAGDSAQGYEKFEKAKMDALSAQFQGDSDIFAFSS